MSDVKLNSEASLDPQEERKKQRNKRDNAYQKANGYAAQKRYRQANKEKYQAYRKAARERVYEPKIRIPVEKKDELSELLNKEKMTLTQMFVSLVYEKYGIDLTKED